MILQNILGKSTKNYAEMIAGSLDWIFVETLNQPGIWKLQPYYIDHYENLPIIDDKFPSQ